MKPIGAKTYAKHGNVTKIGSYFYASQDGIRNTPIIYGLNGRW